jgi:hypothetical protein
VDLLQLHGEKSWLGINQVPAGKVCRDAKNRREGMASQGSYSLDKSDHAKEEGLGGKVRSSHVIQSCELEDSRSMEHFLRATTS